MNEWTYHCRILGVPKDASPAEIKSAYMAQAKLFHPDKHQNDSVAKEKFQQLQESFNYLKKNNNPEASQKKSEQQPVQKTQSQRIWIFISIVCVVMLAAMVLLWPKSTSPIIQIQKPDQSQDVESVLSKTRLYIFKMGSTNEKCSLLSRENAYYQDLVATEERFTNSDCGDVRAFFDRSLPSQTMFVVSPSQESCECQAKYLNHKPKVDGKKSFDDSDLR